MHYYRGNGHVDINSVQIGWHVEFQPESIVFCFFHGKLECEVNQLEDAYTHDVNLLSTFPLWHSLNFISISQVSSLKFALFRLFNSYFHFH